MSTSTESKPATTNARPTVATLAKAIAHDSARTEALRRKVDEMDVSFAKIATQLRERVDGLESAMAVIVSNVDTLGALVENASPEPVAISARETAAVEPKRIRLPEAGPVETREDARKLRSAERKATKTARKSTKRERAAKRTAGITAADLVPCPACDATGIWGIKSNGAPGDCFKCRAYADVKIGHTTPERAAAFLRAKDDGRVKDRSISTPEMREEAIAILREMRKS